jgi:uncharacterized protein YdaU (DUF1376 family)
MTLPYYPMYPRDFFEGTQEMSLELKGAYIMVLNLMYTRGGPISDEPKHISRYIGCSITKWIGKDGRPGIRDQLISMGKLVAADGTLSNPRADGELTKQAEYQLGKAKNRSNPNKDKAQESHARSTRANTDTEPEYMDEESSAPARDQNLDPLEADCRQWANGSLIDKFEGQGLSAIRRLMNPEAGGEPCTRDDVRTGITETAAGLHAKGKRVASLEYFEQPILKARDKRRTPLPETEIANEQAGQGQAGRRGAHAASGRGARSGSKHGSNDILAGLALLKGFGEAQAPISDGPEDGRVHVVSGSG